MRAKAWTMTSLATAAAVGLTLVVPTTASAAEVERRGQCTSTSTWKIELEREDGRIELDSEFNTRRAGQTWRVRVVHNGQLTYQGTRVARWDDDGRPDFEVDLRRRNQPGVDRMRVRAVNTATGEVCVARARI